MYNLRFENLVMFNKRLHKSCWRALKNGTQITSHNSTVDALKVQFWSSSRYYEL